MCLLILLCDITCPSLLSPSPPFHTTASTTRISLRKGKAEQRLAKIVQSPCMPEAEASYVVTNEGINEYKD